MKRINYYSLSGYLTLIGKIFLGVWSILNSYLREVFIDNLLECKYICNARKLMWFIFDETDCRLLAYLNENDFFNAMSVPKKVFDISRSIIIAENLELHQFKLL